MGESKADEMSQHKHVYSDQGTVSDRQCLLNMSKNYEKDCSLVIQKDRDSCTSSVTSSIGDPRSSDESSSNSLDTMDESSSLATCSSSSSSYQALYNLSELMAELPIKRGLSKYYEGKSESFTDISKATSVDDLPKKEMAQTCRKRERSGRSCFQSHKKITLPNRVIKKTKPTSFFPFLSLY